MAPFVIAPRHADRRCGKSLRPLLAAVAAAGCIRGLAWVGMPCSSRHTQRIVDVARQQVRTTYDLATMEKSPNGVELFKAIDEDGNGFLDQREISHALKLLTDDQVSNLMNTMDSNLDGQIDGDEFEDWFSSTGSEQRLFGEAAASSTNAHVSARWKRSADDVAFKSVDWSELLPDVHKMGVDERLTDMRRYLHLVQDPSFEEKKWKELVRAESTQIGSTWKHAANDLAFKAADWTKFLPRVKEMVIDEDLTAKHRYLNLIRDPVFRAQKWKQMRHAASMQWTAVDHAKWTDIVQRAVASTDIERLASSFQLDDDLDSEEGSEILDDDFQNTMHWNDLVSRAEAVQVRE